MCGIIAIIKKELEETPTQKTVLSMLTGQQHRGTQGFGYVAFDDVVKSYARRETRIEIEKPMQTVDAKSIMFHHRMPTSTPNFADCAHPIKVSHKELMYDYYVIHNGIIVNDEELHTKHIKLGYIYQTTVKLTTETENNRYESQQFNDSEALAIDLSRFIEGKQEKIESRGAIAVIALQVNKKNNKVLGVYYGRNTNPLTIKITENALILRSEGEEDDIASDVLFRLDLKTWKTEYSDVKIGESMHNFGKHHSYGAYDYREYAETKTIDIKDETEEQKTDRIIINSFVNTELMKFEERLAAIDENMVILLDALEYYKECNNEEAVNETTEELIKLEAEARLLEDKREELLDETIGERSM